MALDIVWIEPDGTETDLTDGADIEVLHGKLGDLLPEVDAQTIVPAQLSGSTLIESRYGSRIVTLPLLMRDTGGGIIADVGDLAAKFDILAGIGKLRFTESGISYFLNCQYSGGMSGNDAVGVTNSLNWYSTNPAFQAFDPFYYNVNSNSFEFTLSPTPGTFYPFPPSDWASIDLLASETISVNGDVFTWPVWNITGPGDQLILENITTGAVFSMPNHIIGSGEQVVIDARRGVKTVKDGFGNDLDNEVDWENFSSLWALAKGDNLIKIRMSNSSASTVVSLSYQPRYLRAPA